MVRVAKTRTKGLFHLFFAHNIVHHSRTDLKSILKDCCFREAHILAPTIVELFKCFFLLVGKAFLQVLVMPCHIAKQFFHLFGVGSAIFLRDNISVPKFVDKMKSIAQKYIVFFGI